MQVSPLPLRLIITVCLLAICYSATLCAVESSRQGVIPGKQGRQCWNLSFVEACMCLVAVILISKCLLFKKISDSICHDTHLSLEFDSKIVLTFRHFSYGPAQ